MTWLLANAMVAAGLAVLALLLGRWARPAPAVMHGLWLMVLLKLVTPPLFEVPIDVAWLLPGGAVEEPSAAPAVEPVSRPAGTAQPTAIGEIHVATAAPAPAAEHVADLAVTGNEAARAIEPVPSAHAASLGEWLLGTWAIGSSVLLLLVVIAVLRARRRLRALPNVTGPLRREIEALARRLDVAVPELCCDPQAVAPYVWTLGRTRLVLPATALLSCSAKGRAAVLVHELAHLRRRDHWVLRVELALLLLLWWHPLFWFARGQLRLWAELACDAVAVSTVPDAELDYATVLVDAAARPDFTVPGLAILASRPAARVAFERRLTMILNETHPRRISRVWCVPFASLALGLFAVPVVAQQEQERDPIRIEVRINGERVKGLSSAQHRALLDVLLKGQGKAEQTQGRRDEREAARSNRRVTRRRKPATSRQIKIEGLPSAGQLSELIEQGLAEVRREVRADADLRELGITDEVLQLVDGIANGDGIDSSIDAVVRAAMQGAGKMVVKEIRNDPDLKKLGISDGIGELVKSFLGNEHNQEMVGKLARQALGAALAEAKHEIRNDKDLQKLGIAKDVESLIDSVISGNGDFEGDLEHLIEKAMQAAMREIEKEVGDESTGDEKAKTKPGRRRERSRRREIR